MANRELPLPICKEGLVLFDVAAHRTGELLIADHGDLGRVEPVGKLEILVCG